MKPYYQDDAVTIYHGDCREEDGWLAADVVVTDPPFGVDFRSGWTGAAIANDSTVDVRDQALAMWAGPALVFGAATQPEPAGVKARLIWHRPGSGMGDLNLPWKPDWEMVYVIGSGFHGASRGPGVIVHAWDVFRGDALHPHQKPLPLLRELIAACPPGVIADPFMGSGSTLRAAKDLGRRAIGIELDERYCEIAAKRMGQEVLDFGGTA